MVGGPQALLPAAALEAGMMVPPTQSEMAQAQRQVQETKAEALNYLEKKAKPLRQRGLKVECTVMEGSPGPAIIELAGKSGIDLIALATHGRGGLGRAIYGSVAEYVLKNSGLPMLIIRPKR